MRTKRRDSAILWQMLSVVLTLGIGSAFAASNVIQSPVGVIDNSMGHQGAQAPELTIDQSGLGEEFVSGITVLEEYLATNPVHDVQSETRWLINKRNWPGHIDYDMGSVVEIHSIVIWNYDGSSIGIKEVAVLVANDPSFDNAMEVGSFEVTQGDGDPRAAVAQKFSIDPTAGQYVRLQVNSNWNNGTVVGFGEIAFGVSAPVIQSPVGVIDNSMGHQGSQAPGLTIDQSGLGAEFVSGTTVLEEYLATNPVHDVQSETRWLINKRNWPGHIDYDMGSVVEIHSIVIWNYDGSSIGIKEVAVLVANDPSFDDATEVGSFEVTQGDGDPRAAVAQKFSIDPTAGQYVRLQVNSNWENGTVVGFGEIAFGVLESE